MTSLITSLNVQEVITIVSQYLLSFLTENPENRLTDPQFFSRSISSTKERRTSEEREETNKQEIKNKNQNRENTHRRENWRTNREDG